MNRPMRRIFIDCTETCRGHGRAGIPRVVRNLVNAAPRVGRELGLECQGVVFDPVAGFVTVDAISSPACPATPWRRTVASVARLCRIMVKETLAATRLLDGARRLADRIRQEQSRAAAKARQASETGLRFAAGDVLLLPDISWRSDFPWGEIQAARDAGAFVIVMIYDLIPIQYPQEVDAETYRLFHRWWDQVRHSADYFICGSHSVMNEVMATDRAGHFGKFSNRVTTVHHGAELDGLASSANSVRPSLAEIFAADDSRQSYLMVGMMSPRKNHALVLEAFERLWSEGADVRLVIAGKCPANSRRLQRRISLHAELGKRLHWIEDASDADLDFCYRQAAALITASVAEGFNLPIVEALSRRCPVFASDLPVHREVGGAYAAFFPADDAAALAGMIRQHQSQGKISGVQSSKDFRWPDWTETCRELLLRIIDVAPGEESICPPANVVRSAA